MDLRSAVAALALMLAALPAWASPAEISRAIPRAQRVGEAQYRLLAIPIVHAELWAENGVFAWERPFALTFTYQRAARAETLINRSLREMSQRGAGSVRSLVPLRTQMQRCVRDIARGDRLTGVATGADTARFYHNGALRCDVRWPGFQRHFFGIWLAGRDGPAAVLSAQLRGEA